MDQMAAQEKSRQNINMSTAIIFDRPLITVVIATYNRSSLVREAIASVLAQTLTHWELIIADDGSQDDTVGMIRAMTDPRIRVLGLPHTGLIAAVRNAGAAVGSGPWICFLDSDDTWSPQKLEIQLALLERDGRRWAYGGFGLANGAGEETATRAGRYIPHSGWILKELLTCEASVNIGTLMVDRTLFNELGGFDTEPLLNYREDYDLALRLAMKEEASSSPGLLMRVREHPGRVTNSFDNGNERSAYVYRHFIKRQPGKEWEAIAKRQLAFHLAEAAVKSRRAGQFSNAARQWVQAWQTGDSWKHLFSTFRRAILARKTENRDRGTEIRAGETGIH
jgi:glycosyltransferase involved in cell wall biosynthesis